MKHPQILIQEEIQDLLSDIKRLEQMQKDLGWCCECNAKATADCEHH